MIKSSIDYSERVHQGEIYKNIEYIQSVKVEGKDIEIKKIVFPLVIVLTQDCDLEQDSSYYLSNEIHPKNDDKKLLSVIVAPLYNEDLFLSGEHLNDETLKLTMRKFNKKKKGKLTTEYKNLINNETPRYHHIEFQKDIPLVNCIIDFKHYFTVNIQELLKNKRETFICKISELYREDISHRFAFFLSRIGLPNN